MSCSMVSRMWMPHMLFCCRQMLFLLRDLKWLLQSSLHSNLPARRIKERYSGLSQKLHLYLYSISLYLVTWKETVKLCLNSWQSYTQLKFVVLLLKEERKCKEENKYCPKIHLLKIVTVKLWYIFLHYFNALNIYKRNSTVYYNIFV